MLIFQATLRKRTGEQVKHIHQERMDVIDLRDCYVYSGLVVEDDLSYGAGSSGGGVGGQARVGGGGLPRVYREDGWTSQDEEVMTCFVIWRNERRSWFRTQGSKSNESEADGKKAKLKRVGQLGVAGKSTVFKCRSRAERDHWVLSVGAEIERVVEREEWETRGEQVRLEGGAG